MVFPKFATFQFGTLLLAIFCSQNFKCQQVDAQVLVQPNPAEPQEYQEWDYPAYPANYDPYLGLRTTEFRSFSAYEVRYHKTRGNLARNSRRQSGALSMAGPKTPEQRKMLATWEFMRSNAKRNESQTQAAAMQAMLKQLARDKRQPDAKPKK